MYFPALNGFGPFYCQLYRVMFSTAFSSVCAFLSAAFSEVEVVNLTNPISIIIMGKLDVSLQGAEKKSCLFLPVVLTCTARIVV